MKKTSRPVGRTDDSTACTPPKKSLTGKTPRPGKRKWDIPMSSVGPAVSSIDFSRLTRKG